MPQRNRLSRITQSQVNDRFEPEVEGMSFEAGDGPSALVGVVDQPHLLAYPVGFAISG